jgi:parvulin-like peptidyl-prolyl isomerase
MGSVAKKKINLKATLWATVIVMAIVIMSLHFFIKKVSPIHNDHIIGTVNNEPIATKFFIAELNTKRAETYAYFKTKYGVDDSANFWTTSYGREKPLEYAKKIALHECVKIIVQQAWAKREKIVDDIRYEKFINDLMAENKRRKEAVAENKVIYGPVEYSEDSYFNYVFSNLVIKLKTDLGEKELAPSDSELREAYEANKNHYKQNNIKISIISIPWMGGKKQDANAKIAMIENQLKKGAQFEKLAMEYNPTGKLNVRVFDTNSRYSDSRYNGEIKRAAEELQPGQISQPIETGNSECLIQCMENKVTGYRGFDEVKDSLKTLYVEKKYDELVEKMTREANLEIDQPAYRSIKIR